MPPIQEWINSSWSNNPPDFEAVSAKFSNILKHAHENSTDRAINELIENASKTHFIEGEPISEEQISEFSEDITECLALMLFPTLTP